MPTQLSEHFTLDQFMLRGTADASPWEQQPPPELIPNMMQAAKMLERIRNTLGAPIVINSAYRCVQINAQVGGGAISSDHIQGHAVDMVAPSCASPYNIAQRLSLEMASLGIGQLLFEVDGHERWIHVSTRIPNDSSNRVLTIVNGRVQAGIQRI